MVADRYRRIKDLTQRALELDAADRPAFLARECGDDAALLHEVLRLLEYDLSEAEDPTFLDLPEPPDLTGQAIGPYEILERLGEGGMGVVYLAAQRAPLRRRVALKVIKLGMDTREVITRFKSERQALALMDHPNIARVFDAGATDSGRPYFVMEYIQGTPLTRYCQEKGLGLRARLDLFVQVCRGVQHAHQKGVIHRDLKPSNILVAEVEGQPVPKIIDFGVAKATGAQLAARTFFTQLGRLIGTPEYMSPEQADPGPQDIDTRTDVFSLGVILYELLTGVLPIDRQELMGAGWEGIGSLIREKVPPKPSTRLTSLATAPRGDPPTAVAPRTWLKRVRGDLDWITMKALEKEQARRYATVLDLASDIGRYLDDQVVTAGPPSRLYRSRKFVRRHRVGVAAAAAVALAVVAFAGWQTAQSRIIAGERNAAMASHRLALAESKLTTDPTLAVAYALASLEIADQPQTRRAIQVAYAGGPLRDELPRWDAVGNPLCCDTSPDGRLCASSWSHTEPAKIGIYDLADHSLRLLDSTASGAFHCIAFTADGRHVVAHDDFWNAGLHAWRVSDGEHLWYRDDFCDYDSVVLFRDADPDRVVVSASAVGQPTRWYQFDVITGDTIGLGRSAGMQTAEGQYHSPAIDMRSRQIVEYRDRTVLLTRLDDLGTDRTLVVGEHAAPICCAAISPDGTRAATVDLEGGARVWDLQASPPVLIREFAQEPGTYGVKFSGDGQRFVTAALDRPARIFDVTDVPPRLPQPLLDRSHWTHDGAFLLDGSLLTSRNGVDTGPLAIWSLDTPIAWSLDASGRIEAGAACFFAHDRRWMVIYTQAGEIRAVPFVAGDGVPSGRLGETRGWFAGTPVRFRLDATDRFFLFDNGMGSSGILELATGQVRPLPRSSPDAFALEISPGGRLACCVDLADLSALEVVDVERSEPVATLPVELSRWQSLLLPDDGALLALCVDALVRYDLAGGGSAVPDTLWRGDASRSGAIFEDGRAIVVVDADAGVHLVDLAEGRTTTLGTTSTRGGITAIAHDRSLGLVAVGGWWDTVDVFATRTGAHWRLPVGVQDGLRTEALGFDAAGRWLICDLSTRIVAWDLPLDPIFTDLDTGAMLARTRALTNVRVVADAAEPRGFRVTSVEELAGGG